MNKRLRYYLMTLAALGSCSLMLAQAPPVPNIGPVKINLNGASGTTVVPGLSGQSYCTVSIDSTSTMGSGTVTLKTSNDNGASYFNVTGVPDLGNGSGASQTITVAGTQLTAPVSGKTNFEVVLSGGSSAAITGNILCGNGSGAIASNNSASGSSTVTIVAPTDANGNVKMVQPAPSANQPVTQASVPWSISCLAAYPCGLPTPIAFPTLGVVQQAAPLATTPVQPPTPFGVTPCPAASISASVCASPAPYGTAVSPAPGNLLGHGYNSGGVAAPIICHNYATVQIAATTQATETVVIASASGKVIYICSAVMSALGTATSAYGLSTSATNNCGTMTNLLTSNPGASTQAAPVSLGSGVGVIAQTPAGVALCFFNATTSPAGTAQVNIMYEQFLRSLTPEQLDEFCSIPKRCLLYGLVKHLDRLLNRVENPIP